MFLSPTKNFSLATHNNNNKNSTTTHTATRKERKEDDDDDDDECEKEEEDDDDDDVRDDVLLRFVAVRFLRFVLCGGNARVGNDVDAIVLLLFLFVIFVRSENR